MPTHVCQLATETHCLRDGETLLTRAVGPDDAALLGQFFETLSPQTVYNRFLTPMHRLSRIQLERAALVNAQIDCVLAACVQQDECWIIVGVGRFRCCDADCAELAIVVSDRWHRRGIARLLLQRLTNAARRRGLTWFDSTIDPGNLQLLRFAEAVGFKGDLKYRDGLLQMRTDIRALFPETPVDPVDEHERP